LSTIFVNIEFTLRLKVGKTAQKPSFLSHIVSFQVEVAGVEPASENTPHQTSTHIVCYLSLALSTPTNRIYQSQPANPPKRIRLPYADNQVGYHT